MPRSMRLVQSDGAGLQKDVRESKELPARERLLMSKRWKILLTVAAAIIYWYLFEK